MLFCEWVATCGPIAEKELRNKSRDKQSGNRRLSYSKLQPESTQTYQCKNCSWPSMSPK